MISSKAIIIILLILIIFILIGTPMKPMRLIGQTAVKLAIGVLFLFFFNVFGGYVGLHIPINIFTVFVSSFLGLFGIISLAAVHIFIL